MRNFLFFVVLISLIISACYCQEEVEWAQAVAAASARVVASGKHQGEGLNNSLACLSNRFVQ